jgi:hypothetical protein
VPNGAHWGKAQRDLDLHPDRYTHYYKNEFPRRFHPLMDTRRWGPGERLAFEPYTKGSPRRDRRLDHEGRHLRRRRDGPGSLLRFGDFAARG